MKFSELQKKVVLVYFSENKVNGTTIAHVLFADGTWEHRPANDEELASLNKLPDVPF